MKPLLPLTSNLAGEAEATPSAGGEWEQAFKTASLRGAWQCLASFWKRVRTALPSPEEGPEPVCEKRRICRRRSQGGSEGDGVSLAVTEEN